MATANTTASTDEPQKRASINQITRKSRAIHPLLNGKGVQRPDISLLRQYRPLAGLDIEDWRGGLGLSKFDAEAALGFRSTSLYNRECESEVLPIRTEVLLRLYEEKPENYPWKRLSFRDLFHQMYGRYIDEFSDPDVRARARNDLEARFTVLFGRSPTRGYAWLRGGEEESESGGRGKDQANSYSTIERILQKLTQWDDPGATFERVATKSLKLRDIDIDQIFPIPTLERPPERGRPGRKPAVVPKVRKARKAAAPKKAVVKAAVPPAKKPAPAPKKAPTKAVKQAVKKVAKAAKPAAKRSPAKKRTSARKPAKR